MTRPRNDHLFSSRIGLAGLLAIALLIGGCAGSPAHRGVVNTFATGDHGRARVNLESRMTSNRGDRNYMLDRMRVGILTLADGYPRAAEPMLDEVYDVLRTQGINRDRTVASVVINEGLKLWKGEPFEQALAFCYIGAMYAMQGSWDNMRAATSNALFHLRDFGSEGTGRRLSNEEVVRRAAEHGDAYFNQYTPVESNFALAYLLNAVANQQIGRPDDADEQFQAALAIDRTLQPLIQELRAAEYNTLLLVDYGRGPQKVGSGPDNAIARFTAQSASDSAALAVSVNGRTHRYPLVADVNRMAQDHRWNNLEDMRLAKSFVGDVLVTGGVMTALIGADQRSEAAMIAGLGMLLAGAVAKAGAHADTRYCEAMPQRIYLVPVTVNSPDDRIALQVDNRSGSRLVLSGISPPSGAAAQLRFVRLPTAATPTPWAVGGEIHYTNIHTTAQQGRMLPYILGGHCVRPPTYEVLTDYHRAGYLRDHGLMELRELYRAENIRWDDDDAAGFPGVHVLEGGKSLASPLPGTAGFVRLFAQRHPPYRAANAQVRSLAARYVQQPETSPVQQ